MTPLLVDIKHNALDDGPGIRSVIFFKGCPLSCSWCHNPEAISPDAELSFDADRCTGLRDCLAACPEAALGTSPAFVERSACTRCFACTDVCATGALSLVGQPLEVEAVVQQVLRYRPFFENSGGGVTVSGGEPTLHMATLSELLAALSQQGIHTLLQTCGAFSMDRFEAEVLPWTDQIFFDLKLLAPDEHQAHCGADNGRILANFTRLLDHAQAGRVDLLPRIPLVPGVTDTPHNLAAIAGFLAHLGAPEVQLLPHNPLWPDKAKKVGRRGTAGPWTTAEVLIASEALFREAGIATR